MTNEENQLVVPSGDSEGPPITINLVAIIQAQARENELACATRERAQELSVEFNKQWLELDKLVTLITAEHNKASQQLIRREAVIQLDLMKTKLVEKGLSSTADTRKAIIVLDEEYIRINKIQDQINIALEFIKGKRKAMENNFAIAKRLVGDNNFMKNRPNPNIQASTYSSQQEYIPPQESKPRAGFGKAQVR